MDEMPRVADHGEIADQAPCLLDDCLSPRERDVARGVAAELSTRQIAARLAMSPRTVETHLYNIFRKTGVRTRHELAGYARRVGVVA